MLKIFSPLILVLLMAANPAAAEEGAFAGSWHGTLVTPGGSLRLVFHIEQTPNEPTAKLESVDQGGATIPLTLNVEGEALEFSNTEHDIKYQANVSGNEMTGIFAQSGAKIPLTMLRQ